MSVSSSFVAKIREYRKEAFKKVRNEEIKVLEENLRTPLENIDNQINQKLIPLIPALNVRSLTKKSIY